MRGRVEESGGSVQVESAPGRGTRVQVLIPAVAAEEDV
jgi:signal transduction histidine kinase